MKKNRQDEPFSHEKSNHLITQRYFDDPIFDGENEFADDEVSYAEEQPLLSKGKENHGKNIMIFDSVMFVVNYIQMFALLQSLSLRWTWPTSWTKPFSFLFLFNLDVWELSKLVKPNVYIVARDYYVPSIEIPINYRVMLLIWLILLIAACVTFFLLQRYFAKRLRYLALSKLTNVAIIIVEVLALPVGVQIGKLFWCRPTDDTLDIDNSITCWNGEHVAYIVIAVLVAIAIYILFAAWFLRRINKQIITTNTKKHELYLRLKHCEYQYDLDTSWNENLFGTFASYRRFWVFYRPINHLLKFVVICFYAGLFNERLVQISLIFTVFGLENIVSIFRFPYRVSSFNFPHKLMLSCLCACAVVGIMRNIPGINSVFLQPDYILWELVLINLIWLVGMFLWVVYLVLRWHGLLCSHSKLWPTLLKRGKEQITEHTERYITACIDAKQTLKKAASVPAVLSPVHELSRHIKILNALACEAEYVRDPLDSTLRDVLDDVIELHNKLSPVSIFTDSLETDTQITISRLWEVLPAFSRRVQQREFDLILVTPVKRRILLKMFAVACFIRGGKQAGVYEPGVRKLDFVAHLKNSDEGFHEEDSVITLHNIDITAKQKQDKQIDESTNDNDHAQSINDAQVYDESYA